MVALRPTSLRAFIGQRAAREQIIELVDAAKDRHEMPGDILLTGAGGLGKTSLGRLVAERLDAPLRVTMSTSVRSVPNMIKALRAVDDGMVWFLDEAHKVMPTTLLLLYSAIEDREFSVPGEPDPVKLPQFTFVAATTEPDKFDESFRGRFDLTASVVYYTADELAQIITRNAELKLREITPEAAADLARRSRGTPREALRLLRRAIDKAGRVDVITAAHVVAAMKVQDIDTLGLSDLDRRVLEAVAVHFMGTPIGIDPIVTYVGDNDAKKSIRFLQRAGLLLQTKQGQVATKAAYEHLRNLKELKATVPAWRGGRS